MNRESIVGMSVWLALLAVAPWFHGINTVERLFLFAPLVIVPLGFALISPRKLEERPVLLTRAVQLQPAAALLLIVGFLPDAKLSVALFTLPWVTVCALAALHGVANVRRRGVQFEPVVLLCATVYLFVGSCWLFLSRAGMNPAGFQEPIVLLTAVHFHYSGFAAVVITNQLASRCARSRSLVAVAQSFCVGTILAIALIAAGFVFSPLLKVVSVFFLITSLAGAALLTLWISQDLRPHAGRVRLRVSSGAVLAGLALAALYAVGEFDGRPVIGLSEMAVLHGSFNGLGFAFCGMWGWNLVAAKEAS